VRASLILKRIRPLLCKIKRAAHSQTAIEGAPLFKKTFSISPDTYNCSSIYAQGERARYLCHYFVRHQFGCFANSSGFLLMMTDDRWVGLV
jgi:hypothetical protein